MGLAGLFLKSTDLSPSKAQLLGFHGLDSHGESVPFAAVPVTLVSVWLAAVTVILTVESLPLTYLGISRHLSDSEMKVRLVSWAVVSHTGVRSAFPFNCDHLSVLRHFSQGRQLTLSTFTGISAADLLRKAVHYTNHH